MHVLANGGLRALERAGRVRVAHAADPNREDRFALRVGQVAKGSGEPGGGGDGLVLLVGADRPRRLRQDRELLRGGPPAVRAAPTVAHEVERDGDQPGSQGPVAGHPLPRLVKTQKRRLNEILRLAPVEAGHRSDAEHPTGVPPVEPTERVDIPTAIAEEELAVRFVVGCAHRGLSSVACSARAQEAGSSTARRRCIGKQPFSAHTANSTSTTQRCAPASRLLGVEARRVAPGELGPRQLDSVTGLDGDPVRIASLHLEVRAGSQRHVEGRLLPDGVGVVRFETQLEARLLEDRPRGVECPFLGLVRGSRLMGLPREGRRNGRLVAPQEDDG